MPITFSEAVSARPLRLFQLLVVGLTLAVLVLDGMDSQVLGFVVPVIVDEWGIDRAEFGLALSSALFGMGAGALVGGWIGDRLGRLNTLFIAAMIFGTATIGASFVNDVPAMTVLRFIGGIGFGAAGPNALPLASEWVPDRYRSYVITLLSVGIPLGGTIAAGIAPSLLPDYGWRGTFEIFGAIAIVAGVLCLLFLHESPTYLLAKGKAEKASKLARKVLPDEVELVPEESPVSTGPSGTGMFHSSLARLNWGISIGFATATAVVYGFTSWGTELFTSRGYSLDQAIGVLFWIGLSSVVGAIAAGYFIRLLGSRKLLAGCFLVTAATVVLLAVIVEGAKGPPSETMLFGVYAIGCIVGGIASMGIATIYAMMTLGYPVSCRSSGIGFGMMMGRIGGIVMAFFGGYILNFGGESVLPFFGVMAIFSLVACSSAWIIDRHVEPAGRK